MRISIYITSYNQRNLLVEAIESVLNQTLPPNQIIIIDDSSTDGSQKLISEYVSCYPDLITPIYHAKNLGVARTRIDALNLISGDYVSYLDGDDRYLPTKLEKEVRLLKKNPNAKIVFSNNHYIDKRGIYIGIWAEDSPPPQGYVFLQTFARDFPKRSLFRMELVEYQAWRRIGFHDPNLNLYEDFDMRIRLTRHYKAVYCDEPLSEVRIHNYGLSSLEAHQHITALEYIYQKNLPLLYAFNEVEREEARSKLREWIASHAKRSAKQAIIGSRHGCDGRVQALKYYLRYLKLQPNHLDFGLLLKILLPNRAYELLRILYVKVHAHKNLI